MKKGIFIILFYIFSVINVYGVTVDEIVKKANNMAFYQGDTGKAKVYMKIVDENGREREREFIILRFDKEDGGDQKFYVYFKKPGDVRNMVFMVWKYVDEDKDDDRWMYLPALDLVRRIASGDKRTSFTGSHFFYEDVSGRGLKEDVHELESETDEFYVLKNIPKKQAEVEFAYYKVWVNKNNFLPVKIEYFDKKEQSYRKIESLETKEIQGKITVVKSRVDDKRLGGYTISEFTDIEYDLPLTEDVFTERYLRRVPRKWLKSS